MKNRNKYISLFFAAVVAFGVTVSSVHVHYDDFHDVETEQMLVQDELNCVICGSIFKFSSSGENLSAAQDIPETFFFAASIERSTSSFGVFKDGRAPPYLG